MNVGITTCFVTYFFLIYIQEYHLYLWCRHKVQHIFPSHHPLWKSVAVQNRLNVVVLFSLVPYHLNKRSGVLFSFNMLLTLKCVLFFFPQKALRDCFCNCMSPTFWTGCIFLISSFSWCWIHWCEVSLCQLWTEQTYNIFKYYGKTVHLLGCLQYVEWEMLLGQFNIPKIVG